MDMPGMRAGRNILNLYLNLHPLTRRRLTEDHRADCIEPLGELFQSWRSR